MKKKVCAAQRQLVIINCRNVKNRVKIYINFLRMVLVSTDYVD